MKTLDDILDRNQRRLEAAHPTGMHLSALWFLDISGFARHVHASTYIDVFKYKYIYV